MDEVEGMGATMSCVGIPKDAKLKWMMSRIWLLMVVPHRAIQLSANTFAGWKKS